MLIRQVESDLLLIAQVDHAALAGRIMTAWRNEGFATRPTRDRVLDATARHDIGWQHLDTSPSVDPDTGTPCDVVSAPLDLRQGAFPRAVEQIAPRDPYVAALVAHHAVTVYRRFESTPEWRDFFPTMTRRRDELLATHGLRVDAAFLADYAIVTIGDLCSIVFCTGADLPPREGYSAKLHQGRWLEITPDPFDGATVAIDVPAWRVPARRYASDADLRETVARAPIVRLTGVAAGAPPPQE